MHSSLEENPWQSPGVVQADYWKTSMTRGLQAWSTSQKPASLRARIQCTRWSPLCGRAGTSFRRPWALWLPCCSPDCPWRTPDGVRIIRWGVFVRRFGIEPGNLQLGRSPIAIGSLHQCAGATNPSSLRPRCGRQHARTGACQVPRSARRSVRTGVLARSL